MTLGPLAFVLVGLIAFAVSCMTLFAGFGLGTLLLPTFALLFPIQVAVAATAVVHGLNNFFKLALMARYAVGKVVLWFGLPAVLAAFAGAHLMTRLAAQEALYLWELGSRTASVTPIKLVMGLLIILFALFDLSPLSERLRFEERWLPVGGLLSGFFGGLSGHQGALRAAFLLPLGMEPLAFAGTQATVGSLVDLSRLIIYGSSFYAGRLSGLEGGLDEPGLALVGWATVCAFGGAYLGRRMLTKATVGGVRVFAAVLLLAVGLGLASGVI